MNEICFYLECYVSSKTSNKVTTALCVQPAGACQSTQCKNFIFGSVRHILWGVERYFLAFGNKCNNIFDFYDVNQEISAFIDQLLNTNANQNVDFSMDLQLFCFLCN